MHANLMLSTGTLIGFLLTLVRVAGVFVFVPLPGMTAILSPARVILTLGVTIALFPLWPQITAEPSAGQLTLWIFLEAILGLGIGLAVAFVTEAFTLSAQIMGLQAGYAFASTFDPNTQADSTVLVIFAQLTAGMIFFASGLDREVIRIFARSLETYPAGSFVLSRAATEQIMAHGVHDVLHRAPIGATDGGGPDHDRYFSGFARPRQRSASTGYDCLPRKDDRRTCFAGVAHAAHAGAVPRDGQPQFRGGAPFDCSLTIWRTKTKRQSSQHSGASTKRAKREIFRRPVCSSAPCNSWRSWL